MSVKVKYDWYQTDSKVVIAVMLKNAVDKNYIVKINKDSIEMTADDNYELKLELFEAINPTKSSHKATPSKVEITLGKESSTRWESLERKTPLNPETDKIVAAADIPPPKQSKQDWDKLTNEIIETEKAEAVSEEALINLFQKIYSDSSEETRRAMNKSFSESGGTVLSTNWNEVGKEKVAIKPPTGAEFKPWD